MISYGLLRAVILLFAVSGKYGNFVPVTLKG